RAADLSLALVDAEPLVTGPRVGLVGGGERGEVGRRRRRLLADEQGHHDEPPDEDDDGERMLHDPASSTSQGSGRFGGSHALRATRRQPTGARLRGLLMTTHVAGPRNPAT